jgi:hypothetical protein
MKLTAATTIHCDLDLLWQRTQSTPEHARWDIRFTGIEPIPCADPGAPQFFRYTTHLPGVEIHGWGETLARPDRHGSALRFWSDDAASLIREGAGCWIYKPVRDGIRFSTVYDYTTRHGPIGALLDLLTLRPLMIWGTRWSFDRLRLWIEQGISPELSLRLWQINLLCRLALGSVWIYEGLATLLPDGGHGSLIPGGSWPAAGPIGGPEILLGLLLIQGRGERALAVISAAATLLLLCLAVYGAWGPGVAIDGGIATGAGLLAAAAAIYLLAPLSPKAYRAHP